MSVEAGMNDACAAVGIDPPRRTKPGEWVQCPVQGKARSNRSGRVLVFDDGKGGVCWNWVTGQQQRFTAEGIAGPGEVKAPPRDLEADRRKEREQAEVERICAAIVKAATPQHHPYLAAKGFPTEEGLVLDDLRALIPDHELGRQIAFRLPDGDGPWLIVPGRIGKRITTVQIIGPDGAKKNIYRGIMGGAAHRIATGRETWVCEGIATALTVRAALRLLGRSATVLSAFSAQNVGRVANGLTGSIVAADHDKPLEQLGGLGTGEYHARQSGRAWVMPPEAGDFNDQHQREGLRAVALRLRGVTAR